MGQKISMFFSFVILIGTVFALYPLLILFAAIFSLIFPHSYSLIPFVNIGLFLIPYVLMGYVLDKLNISDREKRILSILAPSFTLIFGRLGIFLLAIITFIRMNLAFSQYSGTNILDSSFNMLRTEAGLGFFYFFILPFVNLLIVNLIVHKPFRFKLILEKFYAK